MKIENWQSSALANSQVREFLESILTSHGVGENELGPEASGDLVRDSKLLFSYAISVKAGCAAFRIYAAQEGLMTDIAHLKLAESHYRILQSTYCLTPTLSPSPLGVGAQLNKREQPLPTFMEIQRALIEGQQLELGCAQLVDSIGALKQERDYYVGLTAELNDELRRERARAKQLGGAHHFAAGAHGFESPDERSGEPPPAFEKWDQLPEWCVENADRVLVLPRAFSGAKKALYENPSAAYAGLDFLAGPYRDHKQGRLGLGELQAELERSGLKLAGSVGSSVAGEHKDAYFVPYRGRKRFLEHHLGKGGGRDERYCLRIYFFWDSTDGKVVVGWLPSHLDNSLT